MQLQYASDLHLEFPENKTFLKDNPIEPKGDILILAGDVVPFILVDKHRDFFDYLEDNFQHTYWLPGNHEYYHFDAANKCGAFCESIRSNVSLVNNLSFNILGAHLIFTTLWSKISPANGWDIEKNMNDFRLIKYNGYRFSFENYNNLHASGMSFLEKELLITEAGTKKIVISHHVPTYQNYPQRYKGSILSEAFAVELFGLIENTQPDFWIYGHSHVNTPDFAIGNTRLLTNQVGYVQYNEHSLFAAAKTILL